MSERKPWFCPSCQKHHGPHVDTCPEPIEVIGKPLPPIQPWPTIYPLHPGWQPTPGDPCSPPWYTTCGPAAGAN